MSGAVMSPMEAARAAGSSRAGFVASMGDAPGGVSLDAGSRRPVDAPGVGGVSGVVRYLEPGYRHLDFRSRAFYSFNVQSMQNCMYEAEGIVSGGGVVYVEAFSASIASESSGRGLTRKELIRKCAMFSGGASNAASIVDELMSDGSLVFAVPDENGEECVLTLDSIGSLRYALESTKGKDKERYREIEKTV